MTLCSRVLAGRYHPLQPMAWGLTASALFLLPFALTFGLTLSYPAEGWLLLLYLGIAPTALAFVVFLVGMRHVICVEQGGPHHIRHSDAVRNPAPAQGAGFGEGLRRRKSLP